VEEFKRQNDNSELSLKWVLGNAIAAAATSADADTLIAVVTDWSNGKARNMIILALPNIVSNKARLHDVLRNLARDQDVGAFARRAMKAAKPQGVGATRRITGADSQPNSTSAYSSNRGNSTFNAATRMVDSAPSRISGSSMKPPSFRVHSHALGSSCDSTT
jgi:hypothetical protein